MGARPETETGRSQGLAALSGDFQASERHCPPQKKVGGILRKDTPVSLMISTCMHTYSHTQTYTQRARERDRTVWKGKSLLAYLVSNFITLDGQLRKLLTVCSLKCPPHLTPLALASGVKH